MNLTKEQRLQVYKKMLEIAIEDRKLSMKMDTNDDYLLFGLCACLSKALTELKIYFNYHYKINNMPELIALKPKFKGPIEPLYWWSTKSTSMTRINKLKKVIADMEKEINQITK
jgi:hypothetical protein